MLAVLILFTLEMARMKQVPVPNVHKKKLKEFFVEAAKSTPEPYDINCLSNGSMSSKQPSTISASRKSSSRRGSSRRSSSRKGSSKRSSSRETGEKKKSAPGAKALQEIRRLQRTSHLLIPAAAFIRVVREVLLAEEARQRRDCAGLKDGFILQGMRITAEALQCLQEAAEVQLTNFFTMSYYCTVHARRKTLMVRDCQLARLLLGRNHPLNP